MGINLRGTNAGGLEWQRDVIVDGCLSGLSNGGGIRVCLDLHCIWRPGGELDLFRFQCLVGDSC